MKTETIQIMAGAAMLSAYTFVPILAREHLGISEIFITYIVGGYAAASFIASYIFGRAGDIYGRRVIIRLGLLLATISFSMLLVSTSLEALLIVRMTNGFCIGMYPGALAAYAYESNIKMGRFATWGAAGWAIGTLLAGFAAGYNIYYAFVMSTLFLAIAFASALSLPKIPRISMRVPLFPVETLKRNLHVYLAVLLRHSSAAAVWALWPLFLYDLGGTPFTIAIVQATNSVAQVIFMVSITDRMGSRKLILIGLLASAITFAWFPLARDIVEILPSQIALGLSWACLYVGALKYVTENNKDRSTASGLLQSMLALSGVIGPVIAAVIYTIWPGYSPIMFFATAMSIISLCLFWSNNRHRIEIEPVELIETPIDIG
ncbi:MAG: MFS transporter [Candidatus Thorarchaeota archaeon]|nr:MFS transporter [Candidatus Thorarchaeota archaeon]